MAEPNRKPPASAPETASGGRWLQIVHRLLFNAALEEAMRRHDLDVSGLCDVLLESFGAVVRAADGADALRVLCDACDSIDLEPSASSRLLDSLTWMTDEASIPVDDRLFEALRDAHLAGDAVIEELVRTFDCDPAAGFDSIRFELLMRICRWAIKNKPQPEKVAERLVDECTQRSSSRTDNPSRPTSTSGEQERDVVDLALQGFQEALEETDDPVRLLDALAEVCSEQIPDPQSVGDPTPILVFGSLTEACIDTTVAAGDSRWAINMLWEAYNAAVFDERYLWLEEVMEAYRDAIHAVKDPADLIDNLFGALTGHEDAPSTRWLPDARFVADACLEAIKAGGGPRAALDAVLAAVGSIHLEYFDVSEIIESLCRLYRSVVLGSNRPDEALRQSVEVLERMTGATPDRAKTADILFEELHRAAKACDDPGRCAEVLYEALMNEAVSMDDAWWVVAPLMDEARSIIERGSHPTKALDVLFEALREHRPSESLVLLDLTQALVATSSGDWVYHSG